jgi:cell shape-determining protein MreD
MSKIITNIILIILIGIIQVSFLTTWPVPISSLNLILSLIVFLTVLVSYQQALVWAFTGGIFLELFSALPFGVTTLGFLLTVIVINFLFNNFFTNRSLYSLVFLGFIASITNSLLSLVLTTVAAVLVNDISFLDFNFWSMLFWQPILNVIILGVVFFSFSISTGHIRNILFFNSDFYEGVRKS